MNQNTNKKTTLATLEQQTLPNALPQKIPLQPEPNKMAMATPDYFPATNVGSCKDQV